MKKHNYRAAERIRTICQTLTETSYILAALKMDAQDNQDEAIALGAAAAELLVDRARAKLFEVQQ